MDIYEAIRKIEAFAEAYRGENSGWQPTEQKILPSGDENDTIKIWFNLGEGRNDAEVEALRNAFEAALRQAHPDVAQFALQVRADSM